AARAGRLLVQSEREHGCAIDPRHRTDRARSVRRSGPLLSPGPATLRSTDRKSRDQAAADSRIAPAPSQRERRIMNLPRWPVYPALTVIGVLLFIAFPHRRRGDPYAGAAASAQPDAMKSGSRAGSKYPRVVVLGIDGMDPDILEEVMRSDPDRMTNFRRL